MTEIKISDTLQDLVEQIANAVANAAELVNMAILQAKSEGLSGEQTRTLIVTALKKRNLSDRTIRMYLPEYVKDAKRAEGGRQGNEKRAAVIAAPEPDKAAEQVKPPVEPDSIHPPDDQSTDESDDGTEARWIRFDMPKFASRGVLNAWYDSGGIIYLKVEDTNTIAVESSTEHIRKSKAMEVRTK